jgi:iron complex outermembrane receptor protein
MMGALDLRNKYFAKVAGGLTLSFGAEYRYEAYKLYAGEPDSYANGGGYFVQGGVTTQKNSGSEGYPGYQPTDQVKAHRSNIGFYAEAALDITDKWLIDGAVRFENYSDFGFVNTYKFATRYKITSNFNLRGSFSTGFRAPSLQQLNFSNTNTNVVNGQLVYQKLVPNYSSIARAAGIPALKQEEATNASLGFSWTPISKVTVTVDGYLIKIKNRVVATGTFDSNTVALKPYLIQFNVSAVDFFANAVNTTNTGIDVVIDYNTKWSNKHFKALLAGNIQNINIDQINIPAPLNTSYADQQAFYSTREQYFLKASAPRAKASLNLEYGIAKFSVGTHLTYFGKLTTQGFGYSSLPGAAPGGPGGAGISDNGTGWDPYVTTDDGKSVVPENFVFHGKVTTDIYLNYKFSKQFSAFLGVDNLFNVHPDLSVVPNARNASAYDSESGGPFDSVQMGFNGLRMFTKLAFTF